MKPGQVSAAARRTCVVIAGGMFCGIILIAASGPPTRGGRRPRRAEPPGPAPAPMSGQPGTSEEWIQALRPGPGDRPGRRG